MKINFLYFIYICIYGKSFLTFLLGVIPRAVKEIFDTIRSLQEDANSNGRPAPTFEIHVQFLEVYNIYIHICIYARINSMH